MTAIGHGLRALVVVTVLALPLGGCQSAAFAQPSLPTTAVEACHLPTTAEKAARTLTFHWQTSVELDLPES